MSFLNPSVLPLGLQPRGINHLEKAKSVPIQGTFKEVWETRYMELMVLMAANEVKSCKFNAYLMHEKLHAQREQIL